MTDEQISKAMNDPATALEIESLPGDRLTGAELFLVWHLAGFLLAKFNLVLGARGAAPIEVSFMLDAVRDFMHGFKGKGSRDIMRMSARTYAGTYIAPSEGSGQ